MKKLISILLVATMMLSLSVMAFAYPTKTFPDVNKGDWYYDSATYCSAGYISGYGSGPKTGCFGPADNLQRQDFAVMLQRFGKIQYGGEGDLYIANSFYPTQKPFKPSTYFYPELVSELIALKDGRVLKDVDNSAYYANAVNTLYALGVVNGYENGNFGVGDKITREQAVTMIYNYENRKSVSDYIEEWYEPFGEKPCTGEPLKVTDDMYTALDAYADSKNVSSWARTAFAWAIANGIIKGKNPTTLAPTANITRAEIATILMRLDHYHHITITNDVITDNYDPWA